jgi:hypothetical protein
MTATGKPCVSCRRPVAALQCDACQEPLCKSCEEYLEAGTFSFLETVPPELLHTHYCSGCHASIIEPALESYQATMEQARGVYVFFTSQRKPVRLLKRAQFPIRVEGVVDREETIMRLAFRAVEQGFNAVVDAEVKSEKVRNEGYQTSRWHGVGRPGLVDAEKLEREAAREDS